MRIANLTTMTAMALLALSPAFAAENSWRTTAPDTSIQIAMEDDMSSKTSAAESRGWGEKSQAADQQAGTDMLMGEDTRRVAVLSTAKPRAEYATIRDLNTATGIIGKDVKNDRGQTVASVEDIIIDSGGNALDVVLTHGGFLGLGENRVALPYDQVIMRGTEGDALDTVAQETMRRSRPFTYDQSAVANGEMMAMASTNISVEKILDADIKSPLGETVASASDIHFANGKAAHVLLSLDTGIELGEEPEKVAMNFAELQLVREDEQYHFELSSAQLDKLQNFQQTSGMRDQMPADNMMENMMRDESTPNVPETERY